MNPHLHRLALAVVSASTLAGAVLSVLPALVIGLVTLFYNSAGGVLILLGSLISVLPHPSAAAQGASSLPVFQILESGSAAALSRSAVGTILCSIAFTLVATPKRRQHTSIWLAIAACAALAAIAGGRIVGWTQAPAIALSAVHIAVRPRHR